jgi:hypothetical protein
MREAVLHDGSCGLAALSALLPLIAIDPVGRKTRSGALRWAPSTIAYKDCLGVDGGQHQGTG